MAGGKKQQLVNAILTARFRPDRQGGLLLDDVLPEEMPVDGPDEARESWAGLVALQKRYIDSGVPNPESVATTQDYLHPSRDDLAQALTRLEVVKLDSQSDAVT